MKSCLYFVLSMFVILLQFVNHVLAMRHTDHALIKNVLLNFLISYKCGQVMSEVRYLYQHTSFIYSFDCTYIP